MEHINRLLQEINTAFGLNLSCVEEKTRYDTVYCIFVSFKKGDLRTKYCVKRSISVKDVILCLEFMRDVSPAIFAEGE